MTDKKKEFNKINTYLKAMKKINETIDKRGYTPKRGAAFMKMAKKSQDAIKERRNK